MKRAFTLIEVLTVSAISLVLVSMTVPMYRDAIEQAHLVTCMNNQRQLSHAWLVYADDNDGYFPSAWDNHRSKGAWIKDGLRANGEGYQDGVLYPYLNSKGVFSCPKDERLTVSYQMSQQYDYEDEKPYWKNMSDIQNPQYTLLFTEEDTWRPNADNAWVFDTHLNTWQDDIALWHFTGMTVSHPDGHIGFVQWTNPRIWTEKPITPNGLGNVWHQRGYGDSEDFQYMKNLVFGFGPVE